MADEFERRTRKTRFEKKRTNTKAISWLSIAGGILIVVIILLIAFGGDDNTAEEANTIEFEEVNDPETSATEQANTDTSEEKSDQQLEVIEKEEENKQEDSDEDQEEEDSDDPAEVESDDPNVARAYQDSWQAVGTTQSEPHTTNYSDGSQDREEMALAVEQALGIAPENQITWWVGRAGDQSVEVTVSPVSNQNETYRVHLQWLENDGWQPTLVEELIENDKN